MTRRERGGGRREGRREATSTGVVQLVTEGEGQLLVVGSSGITMWLYTDRMYTVLIQLIRRLLVFDGGYYQNKLRAHTVVSS